MKKTGAVLVGSALSLVAGHAAASGFSVSYQSVSALGTAYAGAGVLSENASNQWYNPATLAGLKQAELSAAVHQVWVDTTFEADSDGSFAGLIPQSGVGPGDFEDVEPFVGSLFMAVPISDMMTFGLGVNAPFGTKIEYESNWGNSYLTPLGPVSAGDLYSTESDLRTYNINPSLGVQLTDALSVGVGVSYQRLDADIRNAATRLEGDDDSYGWNLGLKYSPDDNNHFGVAYRSKIEYDVEGDITFSQLGANLTNFQAGAPVVAAGSYSGEAAIDLLAAEPEIVSHLRSLADYFRCGLKRLGIAVRDDPTPIIPVVVGDPNTTMELSAWFLEKGVFIQGIRPPTVASGQSLLRVTVSADLTQADLDMVLALFTERRKNFL